MMAESKTKCVLCSGPIEDKDADQCDRCWELEKRIHTDPELARAVLDELDQKGEIDG